MLELNDPLWSKLDDAHRDRDIAQVLLALKTRWNTQKANSLFYDHLYHQHTCYGATYAAFPHLIEMAMSINDKEQKLDITAFLGHVALHAQDPELCKAQGSTPQGLPNTTKAWDQKLDTFRSLLKHCQGEDRNFFDFKRKRLLRRYKHVLAVDPINEQDLEQIERIRQEFFASLADVKAICEQAILENLDDKYVPLHLLSGLAAADGLHEVAALLEQGEDGSLSCRSCGCMYEYMLFETRVACYAFDDRLNVTQSGDTDKALQDYKDGKPERADNFLIPAVESDFASNPKIIRLFHFATLAIASNARILLEHFLGRLNCDYCNRESPVSAT